MLFDQGTISICVIVTLMEIFTFLKWFLGSCKSSSSKNGLFCMRKKFWYQGVKLSNWNFIP